MTKKEESRYGKFIAKNKNAFLNFTEKLKQEGQESREAFEILKKYVETGEITTEEEQKFRAQVYDIMKMVGIGVPLAVLPGATIIIPIILKFSGKYGINLLPSSFSEKEDRE
jgi:hypothetical protein